ncbi:hypothetical protein [Nitrosomonas communis]|uniref:hypothetical protein n=1 Tax=Nitrosomonas communis TaxID=44574 RepID=UPI001160A30A|nr:hypothetical protein [Nitrosomonas communis]
MIPDITTRFEIEGIDIEPVSFEHRNQAKLNDVAINESRSPTAAKVLATSVSGIAVPNCFSTWINEKIPHTIDVPSIFSS